MQCPPTNPGLNGMKFHFDPAASSTSSVSMPIRSKIKESSLTKAILRSLCVFSITFAASATFILGANQIPAGIIELYNLEIDPYEQNNLLNNIR